MRLISRLLFVIFLLLSALVVGTAYAQGDPPEAQDVIIPGVVEKPLDGVTTTDIMGTFYPAVNGASLHPAILMLPQMMDMSSTGHIVSPRDMLADFARDFQARGVNVLTVDLSGYGWGGTPPPSMLDGMADVEAAYNWLQSQPGVDPDNVGVLGSSIGANYGLLLMERIPTIPFGLIFSPAPDYGGLQPNPSALVGRSILVYAGDNEIDDADYRSWLESFPNFRTPGPGHGTFIFSNQAMRDTEMPVWLQLMNIQSAVASGEITPIAGAFQVMQLLDTICLTPYLIGMGGLYFTFRRRRRLQ